ncbi:MAG: MarR family winged helix-turn-helix transcriptional regulator [Candidatus Limnocylindrales bacterium]
MEPDGWTRFYELDDEIDSVLERVVYGAVGITTVVLGRATPGSELTFAQWRVLVVLGRHEAGLRVGEIATRIGATGSATSRLLGRMERRGLVVSEPDKQDGRAAIVRLSDAGERLRARIVQDRRDLIRQLLDDHGRPLPLNLQAGLEAIAEAFARYA